MILVIDNYDSFTYNLVQIIRTLDQPVRIFSNDTIDIAEIQRLSPAGIILSPGPGRPEEAGICLDAIRHFAQDLPILGVCLGHQAIASAFGAEIIQAPNIVHGKSSSILHHDSPLYQHIPQAFQVGRYHSLIVARDSLPSTLSVDATTDNGIIMGVRHNLYPCYGVQFHPESILSTHGATLIQNFMTICHRHKT